jgi:CHAT domain-containing protein
MQALVDNTGVAAALVEFCVLPSQVVVFVLRAGLNRPIVIPTTVSPGQLQSCVRNYDREVTRYAQLGEIGRRWQALSEPLLAEVLSHLQGTDLVYLVPHGLLHYLPLHALVVAGKCLSDRFQIAYAPSAAVLSRVIRRARHAERAGKTQALVAGNPTLDLRHAETEAQDVARRFGVRAHLGDRASKATILPALATKDVIHLAGHGRFDPTQPLESGVVFAGGEILTAREIMGLRLQADLVTLSACATGLSEISRGDELIGLTRSLLYAGASSVLVSLWSVEDESTGQLMADFYRRLYDGQGRKIKTKASALREAMQAMQEQRKHPYYWAPFVLVGDWR